MERIVTKLNFSTFIIEKKEYLTKLKYRLLQAARTPPHGII